ncbi:RNA ligase family protein [Thermomonospora umbrina]|uniref:Putative kinase n=1 Tax=Thermomonospora umbrina TaxID=111806 RepID=A0A3D9SJA5_9ACTN|nr:RNA ligase family protein [Thermomonospora umbrina]REE95787.1 putative kinase [Thermomonospora umbrina]
MRVHYPRTPHLPWSPGVASDDVRAGGLAGLAGREVVVTEKLDGENTTLYSDGLHARSLDSAHHPSRAWVKALHGRIGRFIPPGWRVCGENMFARHSIAYDDLESWFHVFSVWADDRCLSWDDTVRFARRLGVPTVPVLWRGPFDERALRAMQVNTGRQEGYVVRTAEGFHRDAFADRVAKWVRRGHVQTDEHWMLSAVVENGLSPAAALWEARSGATPDVSSLLRALGPSFEGASEPALADVYPRLDLLGRSGESRLAGVLAALLHAEHRPSLLPRLVGPLGMRQARRVADLVGLHTRLRREFPDAERRAGLTRMSAAADLGVLHAVAASALAGRDDAEAVAAREEVAWSELNADDAGLLDEDPLGPLRDGLREALADHDPEVADRCWAEAREAYASGKATSAEAASALTWRWRSGEFPRLVVLVGPSGGGKSTFARNGGGIEVIVSLDGLREARGSRADQRANPEILTEGLAGLAEELNGRAVVAWDATSLNPRQRSLVHAVGERRDALVTHAVMVVPEESAAERNARRDHPVPPEVLAAQFRRYVPPYPGEAHRVWYVGEDGAVHDVAGSLWDEE